VQERTRLHETYIVQTHKTKRLGLVLAALLLILSCLLPVIAPAGREGISYIISVALFVFAAGAAGYTNVWFKTKTQNLKLNSD
jgi:hypothetical protein